MKGLNCAYFIGHIGRDPELKLTAGKTAVLKLSLATPNRRQVGEQWVDQPDWHRLTAFGREAEYLSRYARKGDVLAVECSVRPNKWQDQKGETHYDVSLIIDRVLALQSKVRVPVQAAPVVEPTALPAVEVDGAPQEALVAATEEEIPF